MSIKCPSTKNQVHFGSFRRKFSGVNEENILNETGSTNRRPGKKSRLSIHPQNGIDTQQQSIQNSLGQKFLISPDPWINFNLKKPAQDSTHLTPEDSSGTKSQNIITPQEHDASITLASMSGVTTDSTSNLSSTMKHKRDRYGVPFPQAIYKMVTETVKRYPSIIEWVCDGEAFKIHQKHRNISTILKNYFRHGKYSSVQRQLNMYGWSKHLTGKYKGAFHNPDFHRDSTLEQLTKIRRRGPPSSNKKALKAVVVKQSPQRCSMAPVACSSKQTSFCSKNSELETQSRSNATSTNTRVQSAKVQQKQGYTAHEDFVTNTDYITGTNIATLARKQLEKVADVNLKNNDSCSLSPYNRTKDCETKSKYTPSRCSMELYEKWTSPPPNLTPLSESAAGMSMEQAFGSPINWSPFFPNLFQEPVPLGNTGVSVNGTSTPLGHSFSSRIEVGSNERILIKTRGDFTTSYQKKADALDTDILPSCPKESNTTNSCNLISNQFRDEVVTDYRLDSERDNVTIPLYHPFLMKQNSSEPLMCESAGEKVSQTWNILELSHTSIPSCSSKMMSETQDSNRRKKFKNIGHGSNSGINLEESNIGLEEAGDFFTCRKELKDLQDQSKHRKNKQVPGKINLTPLFGSKRNQNSLFTTFEPSSLSEKSSVIRQAILSSQSPSRSSIFNSDSYSKEMLPVPPVLPLSREGSSSYAPIPLTQRVSSSFYLQFVGLSETLSDALSSPSSEESRS